jgi:2-haloacid dehalogenase
MLIPGIRALLFDVFGTVVDWRGSIIREGEASGIELDWGRFADRWRAGYPGAMDRVRRGELPWKKIDELHRMVLDELIVEFGLERWSEAERDHWNRVWHRLTPWPDAVAGLTRLKQRYTIATLSNGNMSLLVDMAKHGGLPWDAVLSAELFRHYKPDREVYLGAAELLDCRPHEVTLVAAHASDLRAARACGLRTAFVFRRDEKGPGRGPDLAPDDAFDIMAVDFEDLAEKFGV